MQITEKQIPLNAQDYEKLKATKGGGLGCFLIVAVVWLIVSGFLYLLVNDLFSGSFRLDNGRIDLPSGIVVVPFSLVFLVLAFFIYRRYRGKASMDIRRGVKKVVASQVARQFKQELDPSRRTKFANTTAYLIDIDGKQYDVKEEDYSKYSEGMPVEVHTAIHSGEFLGIYDPRDGKLLTEELL